MQIYNTPINLNFNGAPYGYGAGPSGVQLAQLTQTLMSILSTSLGIGAPVDSAPLFSNPNFGGQPYSPADPGLFNFCGGFGANGPNHHRRGGGFPGAPFGRPAHATGQLSQEGQGKPIRYTTSGGYKIAVNKHDISITDPQGNEVKHHGDPHENLNGKHLKDWEGKQRTVVLGDGTKVTLTADGPHGVTRQTSIYDRNRNIQIDNNHNKVKHQSDDQFDTRAREYTQHDGETARFTTNGHGGASYFNVYNQTADGNTTHNYRMLGTVGAGGAVHDFYEDPRLKNT